MKNPGPHFIVPEPLPNDRRPRNAFGILKGFGKAYAAYYAAQDNKLGRVVSPKH